MNLVKNVDNEVLKTVFTNFIVNGNLVGWQRQEEIRQKYNCNVPWAILLDPTSFSATSTAWAAGLRNTATKLNLTFDEIDNIITQGKDLGVYIYIYTGGEPMVRKDDLIALCNKHNDCVFLCFTNATLIDEEFADNMLRVKNFIPAISLEALRRPPTARRGQGVYQKVINAMELLKERHLPFGISACYTSANMDSITSEAFMDKLIDLGAYFIWFFHYMPVGNDASRSCCAPGAAGVQLSQDPGRVPPHQAAVHDGLPERRGVCRWLYCRRPQVLHINANGDMDPCVFIHYSDSNIREKSLLEVLTSPLFMAYHDNQPFNCNHLRPCPMLENPEKIREIIERTGAHSTDLQSPESVEHLTEKTQPYAQRWTPTAEKLWSCSHDCAACQEHTKEGA